MTNGRIPDDVIEAVLSHYDIVDFIGRYVQLTKQGKYMKGLCPFHSEKTPSFTVTPEKQIYYCYGCGKGGNAINFLMEIEGQSFPEAVRHLSEDANIPFEWSGRPQSSSQEYADWYEAYELTAKFYHYLLKNTEYGIAAVQYLRERGFSDKLIDQFQIGYAPGSWDTLLQFLSKRGYEPEKQETMGLLIERSDRSGHYDRFRDRIIFPITDQRGRIVAFAGRILHDGQPKYMNSPESPLFNKGRLLYNLPQARASIRKLREIVLFEGYVDVIKAWDAGVTNGVASMGTALTEEHAARIKQLAEQAIICYDGDDAGQTAAYKNADMLENAGCHVKVAMLPGRMDPDEFISTYGGERFTKEIIQNAVSSTKFRLIYLKKNHILLEETGKLNYIKEALAIIAERNSPTEREHFLKELASEYGFDISTLKQEMNEIRQQSQKMKRSGDNKDNSWNNGMNKVNAYRNTPVLLPAYHNAERKLLAAMFHDDEVARYVQERLEDRFNVEAHAALAAYLYAYYAQGKPPDASRYIATLQDGQLERAAGSILMTETAAGLNAQVIDDYIREIQKVPQQMEIERRKEEIQRAEREGDVLRAAEIAIEIIALERQLKATQG